MNFLPILNVGDDLAFQLLMARLRIRIRVLRHESESNCGGDWRKLCAIIFWPEY